MKTYRILDWKKAREKDRKSIERWRGIDDLASDKRVRQDSIVKEPLKLPMVNNKDTVLVFAGSTGEISSRIAGPRVIHSDADSRRARIADARYGKKYEGVLVADATSLPAKNADWLFSFEPSPLMNRPYFVPRAIASSKKGFIISRRPMFYKFSGIRKVAKMYGITPREVTRKLLSADVYGGRNMNKVEKRNFEFVIFKAGDRAKKLAEMDNAVIERLGAGKKRISISDVERLRGELGVSKKDMRDSLERINEMVSLRVDGIEIGGRYPKHLVLPNIRVEY